MADLVERAEKSMKAAGFGSSDIAAMMKKANLVSGLTVEGKSMEGREEAFNEAAVIMSRHLEELGTAYKCRWYFW